MPDRTLQLRTEPGLWPPTWPMGLTMLRLLLLPVFLWVLLMDAGERARPLQDPHRWWALGVFAVMALTDKLDGYLARRLNQTSKLGAMLDPLADKLLIACSVILLSFEWVAPAGYRIPGGVVLAVYGKDVIVAVGTVALLSLVGKVTIRPRPLGKLSTVLQLSMVIGTLAAPDLARIDPAVPRWLLTGLWWGVPVVAVASCVDYVLLGIRQFKESRRAASNTELKVPSS